MSSSPCGCDEDIDYKCMFHSGAVKQDIPNQIMTSAVIRESFGPLLEPVNRYPEPKSLNGPIQTFNSGATRNLDADKFDYEAFLNPEALHAFATYMHEHRKQKDGTLRDGDNWQKGMPFRTYIKSLVRHTMDLWRMSRGYAVTNPDTNLPHTQRELCCAIVFNAMGYLKELVDPSAINQCSAALPVRTNKASGQMKVSK